MGERASDWFDSEAELIEMVDKAADRQGLTNDELKFIDDIGVKTGRYGIDTFMSEKQYEWLKRIAEG